MKILLSIRRIQQSDDHIHYKLDLFIFLKVSIDKAI